MSNLYSLFVAEERIRNNSLAKKNPNKPSQEGEFGEISDDEMKEMLERVQKKTQAAKMSKILLIMDIVSLVLITVMFILAEYIEMGNGFGTWFAENWWELLLFLLVLAFLPLLALIAIKSISSEAVREMFLSKGRKISLQGEQLLYSYSSLNPSAQEKGATVLDNFIEYRIPYRNIKSVVYDENIEKYSINCTKCVARYYSAYEEGNKDTQNSFTDHVFTDKSLLLFDTFEDKTVFGKIAEKASVQIQSGKVKQISHPVSYYASIALALFLIWSMTIVCGYIMVDSFNSPTAKLERQAKELGTTVDYIQINSEMISEINAKSNMGMVFMEPMPENLLPELNEDGVVKISAAEGEVIGYYSEYPEDSSEYYLATIMAKPVANSDILGLKSGDSYSHCVEVLTGLGFEKYLDQKMNDYEARVIYSNGKILFYLYCDADKTKVSTFYVEMM